MKAIATLNRQNGAVLVATVLALFVILGMAGLAIDSGHSFSNKTRLQNSVDAAALAAAMKLLAEMQTRVNNGDYSANVSVANANLAGTAIHNKNLADFGTNWLNSPSAIQFCWSDNLQDFSTCKTTFKVLNNNVDTVFYVRAEVATTSTLNFIMQVIPGISSTRSVGSVAVAGTIGHLLDCNIAPFYVCDKSTDLNNPDTNCKDDGRCFGQPATIDATAAPDPTHYFGIKLSSTGDIPAIAAGCVPPTNPSDPYCVWVQDKSSLTQTTPTDVLIAPKSASEWSFNPNITLNGNRLLLNLADINGVSNGADGVRDNILNSRACIDPNDADTQPGNVTSIEQAINALFGEPSGEVLSHIPNGDTDYYADWVKTNPMSFRYYKLMYDSNSYNKTIRYHQRLRNVPVVKCPADMNGNVDPIDINGYACFFLARKMYAANELYHIGTGQESFVIAEHVDRDFCPPVLGVQGGNPNNILDAKIVLFQYYGSTHS
jgi:Flp pilus assembly protein TadG